MELRGFEPRTFCMPCRRATNCAIAPRGRAAPAWTDRVRIAAVGGSTKITRLRDGPAPTGRRRRPARGGCRRCARPAASPPGELSSSTDQEQFASPPKTSQCSTGRPSRVPSVARVVPPWVTTTRTSPAARRTRARADQARSAAPHLGPALPGASGGQVGAAAPGGVGRRVRGIDLGPAQPLPGTAMGLAQLGVVRRAEPGESQQRIGGRAGPHQVGADDRLWRQPGQQPSGPLGLLHAHLIELDVELALEPALGVPGRTAVAPEDDAPWRSNDLGHTTPGVSAGSAIVGQSFQSRSRE